MEKETGEATKALLRILDGDENAVTVLIDLYEEKLQRIARAKLNRSAVFHKDEFDATQSVFWSFLKSFKRGGLNFVNDRSSFEAIIVTLMRRKIQDYVKTEKRAKRGGGAVIHASVCEFEGEDFKMTESIYTALRQEILEVMSCPKTKQVVGLTLDGLQRSEIAEQLGMSERTVFRRLETARTEISKHF